MPTNAAVKPQIDKMRRSLVEWLKYRRLLDAAADKNPTLKAQVEKTRDWDGEHQLAERLYDILMKEVPEEKLPDPEDKGAAVVLAQMALGHGAAPTGAIPTWLIAVGVGAVALIVVSGNIASGLAAKEKAACIAAGACQDDGGLLKMVALLGGAYLVWNAFGVGDAVRGTVKATGDRAQRYIRGRKEDETE
jgi:hypothetical protein